MSSLGIAEWIFLGLLLLIAIIVAVDVGLESYHHSWRPRMCLHPNGSIVSCPVEFGGAPPPIGNDSFNWSVMS